MPDRDRAVLRLYREHRIREQVDRFYRPRGVEYRAARRQSLLFKAILLALGGVAGGLAAFDAGGIRAVWSVLAAAFPALSTALVAYDGLFAFDRLAKLYGDVVDSVSLLPEPSEAELTTDASALREYVDAVEGVFLREQGQWGQLTGDIQLIAPPAPKS